MNSKQRAVLIMSLVSAFLTPFMGSAVNIALPTIGHDFKIGSVALSWIATSFLLASGVFLVPFGRLADIIGRKKVYLWGIFFYTLTSALCALSVNTAMLIAARTLQGIAAAMMFGTGFAILSSVFGAHERGKVFGINSAMVYISLALGPFLGGILTTSFGWRSIFIVSILPGVFLLMYAPRVLKGIDWADSKGESFDTVGTVLYALTIVPLIWGFSHFPSAIGFLLFGTGVCALILFILRERKIIHPLLDIRLFSQNRVFAMSSLAALINYSATFGVGFMMSLYLQYIKGFTPRHAGIILIAQPVFQAICSPIAGRLADKVRPQIIASIGMAFTAIGLFLCVFIGRDTSIAYIVFSLIVLGFGFGTFVSPNTSSIMNSVEKRLYGVASGTLGTMRITGQMLSMGIVMMVFSMYIRHAVITPAVHTSFLKSVHLIFIIFAVLCTIGIFLSLSRKVAGTAKSSN